MPGRAENPTCEATRRLRALNTAVQVVIFTACAGSGLERAAYEAGAFGLVAKGSAPDRLLAMVLRAYAAQGAGR